MTLFISFIFGLGVGIVLTELCILGWRGLQRRMDFDQTQAIHEILRKLHLDRKP